MGGKSLRLVAEHVNVALMVRLPPIFFGALEVSHSEPSSLTTNEDALQCSSARLVDQLMRISLHRHVVVGSFIPYRRATQVVISCNLFLAI